MTDQSNNEEREPIRFTDKRRIDPETGELRDQADQASEAEGTEEHSDPLSQVEDILNAAGAQTDTEDAAAAEDAPEADEAAELREDLLRLQAEFVNYRRRVERDRAVVGHLPEVGVADGLDGSFVAVAEDRRRAPGVVLRLGRIHEVRAEGVEAWLFSLIARPVLVVLAAAGMSPTTRSASALRRGCRSPGAQWRRRHRRRPAGAGVRSG